MRTQRCGRISERVGGVMLALVLSLMPVVGGCQKSSNQTTKQSASNKGKTGAGRVVPGKTTVKMLSTGSGPKRRLRYQFRAGETHRILVTIAMSVGVATQERSVPVQRMPAMQMVLAVRHREVTDRGTLKYAFELVRAGLVGSAEGGDEVMKRRFSKVLGPALQMLVGLKGSGEVTPAGVATQAVLNVPGSIPGPARKAIQTLKEQLQQFATPLPAEAVGVGAKWVATAPVARAAVRMGQDTTYTVIKMEGARVTLDVRVDSFAPAQELKVERMPKGAKAQLHSLVGSGTGRLAIDLTRTAPRGAVRYKSTMDQTVTSRGRSQRMQLSVNVDARFAEVPATVR